MLGYHKEAGDNRWVKLDCDSDSKAKKALLKAVKNGTVKKSENVFAIEQDWLLGDKILTVDGQAQKRYMLHQGAPTGLARSPNSGSAHPYLSTHVSVANTLEAQAPVIGASSRLPPHSNSNGGYNETEVEIMSHPDKRE